MTYPPLVLGVAARRLNWKYENVTLQQKREVDRGEKAGRKKKHKHFVSAFVFFVVLSASNVFDCFCIFLLLLSHFFLRGVVFALFQAVLKFYSMLTFVKKNKKTRKQKDKNQTKLVQSVCLPLLSFFSSLPFFPVL